LKYTFLIFILFYFFVSPAQDLEQLNKKDVLKVNGGLNYSSVFYNAAGIPDRRQPFTYFVSGNITGNIAGISLPYTFNYSNNQIRYTQPYNINCFNPSYKWAKASIGVTSMNFSPYTMAGHIFTGAGIELSPKNIKFSALFGRFKKATEFDFENNSDAAMAYKRIGYGASLGYEKNGHSIKAIYFSAKDDPNSLSFVPINTAITPMENTVVSLAGKTTLHKNITLEGEYALSGLTRNVSSPSDLNAFPPNRLPLIFSPNATSQFFAAYKGSIGYRLKMFGINFNYERVEPEYRTLGAYYFNNDLENFTLAPNLTLLGGKLNLNANTGLQRNNLKKDKMNTTTRWVGSFSASYAPTKNWNFMGSYSNFSSFTKQRPQTDPYYKNTLDTLNFYQLSQSAMTSVMYNFGSAALKQNILFSGNYQVSAQKQGAISEPGFLGNNVQMGIPSTVLNGNVGHNLIFTEKKITAGYGVNANRVLVSGTEIIYAGPNLTLGQSFYKNLMKLSIGSSYNKILTNGSTTNEVFSHRLSFSYNPKFSNERAGKMSLSLSVVYLQKLSSSALMPGFNEFTGNVGLNYSF
jgi:hypothetical protein